ncbi:hypothetical protein JI721_14390 [Alicyclobacillus cycloheptanicus]|uniref:Uncharacterized protein n=1 Tax=Alicyclobacillus cycloheptanicus TaxID=1457 RepID=A0ABT9XL80_9BACL|nr:hypothetical protein [Alicyclobacillus cycloheptanicus]MDQ0191065.1 hypothetical protein [Alicyclobacillus cycloheptanicus]WDM00861.1 hypothetical protein JI721_14390 [Alicyclobacillus cycloheptanicus]
MAKIDVIDDKTIRISVELADAVKMVDEAASDIPAYASDIVTIYEKMPAFNYTSFCFYAYDSAKLFEFMLGMDPRNYNSFSLDAPDAFFYTLYGGMAALYDAAKAEVQKTQSE